MKDGLLHAKTMGQKRDLHAYKKKKRELRATYFKNRAKCGGPSAKKGKWFFKFMVSSIQLKYHVLSIDLYTQKPHVPIGDEAAKPPRASWLQW